MTRASRKIGDFAPLTNIERVKLLISSQKS